MNSPELQNITDVDTLITALSNNVPLKYVFFWKHQPQSDDHIDKSCLSQWWSSSPAFIVDGISYPTVEHFMMAEKARLFNDPSTYKRILTAPHPRVAKRLGREVHGFDEKIWQKNRLDIVKRGNWAKFTQNERLRAFLLNTRGRVLVEASPYDKIWGIGLSEDDPHVHNPEKWQGQNLLGFALMTIRVRLEKEPAA